MRLRVRQRSKKVPPLAQVPNCKQPEWCVESPWLSKQGFTSSHWGLNGEDEVASEQIVSDWKFLGGFPFVSIQVPALDGDEQERPSLPNAIWKRWEAYTPSKLL